MFNSVLLKKKTEGGEEKKKKGIIKDLKPLCLFCFIPATSEVSPM